MRPAWRAAAVRALHLWVLTAFAVAQPLFDLLGRNAAFFAVRGSSPTEIVLFAIAVAVVPALVLTLAEAVVATASRRATVGLHFALVAALAAVVALQVLERVGALSDVAVLGGAAAAGVALAVAYARSRLVPQFLTVLGPAPLVFVALFLFASPVSKLLAAPPPVTPAAGVRATTPVVMIVFDELSTVSLLNGDERIDAVRFPSFAALAEDATWYRSATTVHGHTELAVPAILTGRVPRKGQLPVLRDHPRNIFTLLSPAYRMRVLESLTHLCPPSACRATQAAEREERPTARARSLASDVGVVYLHVVLPSGLERHVPPISDTWRDFGKEEAREAAVREIPACGRNVCDFARLLTPSSRPTLYLLHAILPHVPWLYLPSGRRYGGDVHVVPGAWNGFWRRDSWLATLAYQRYFLQLGYTDRALGVLLRRLRSSGLYDKALVVVAADHGLSFRAGEPRRSATPANADEIGFVPLFVKLPGQRRGAVDDRRASTVDILPTIADVLDVRVPWKLAGKSLLRSGRRGTEVRIGEVRARLGPLLDRRRATLRRQLDAFGTGPLERIHRAGPNAALIGTEVAAHPVDSSTQRVELEGADALRAVDPSSPLAPVYVTGVVRGGDGGPYELAAALAGRIVAVSRTYSAQDRQRFAVLLPERALVAGRNELTLFRVVRRGGRSVLLTLRGGAAVFTLGGGRRTVRAATGETFRVRAGAIRGSVSASAGDATVRVRGWAVDVGERSPAQKVVVFAGKTSVFSARAHNARNTVAYKRYGLRRAGFSFEFPSSLLPRRGARIAVYALSGRVASPLPIKARSSWRPRR